MEDDLDEIAGGREARVPWLRKFWFGNGTPGVKTLVADALEQADPAEINAIPIGKDENGDQIVVRNGKYGPYVKRGDDTASLPPDLPLDELTIERAVELLDAPKGDDPIGTDPATGLPVYAKNGRFGPYVALGDIETLPAGEKPKMASLFKTMDLTTITLDDALKLLSQPRVVGADPTDGTEITAQNGRYGPYLAKGKETRSLQDEEQIFSITLDEALAVLALPKYGAKRAPAPPLKELGPDPVTGEPIVLKDGRFGPYVTDGISNASLRKGDTIDNITPERAAELLVLRREYDAANPKKKKAPAKKAAAKKKAPAKKAAAKKKAPAKKAAAEQALPDPPD
jgi:DNA topoisomerase-1